jgi:hypothetical protein
LTAPSTLAIDFSCDLPCSYEAQVVDARTGALVASVAGKAVGEQTIAVPADALDSGNYQYVLRALKCGKPGTAEARYSQSFAFPLGVTSGGLSPAVPTLPVLPQAKSQLPTLMPTVPAAG